MDIDAKKDLGAFVLELRCWRLRRRDRGSSYLELGTADKENNPGEPRASLFEAAQGKVSTARFALHCTQYEQPFARITFPCSDLASCVLTGLCQTYLLPNFILIGGNILHGLG